MSGAGRRTVHRETGSGGWPNGLTVDYLEKRILWIDARSVPSTTSEQGEGVWDRDDSGEVQGIQNHKQVAEDPVPLEEGWGEKKLS